MCVCDNVYLFVYVCRHSKAILIYTKMILNLCRRTTKFQAIFKSANCSIKNNMLMKFKTIPKKKKHLEVFYLPLSESI